MAQGFDGIEGGGLVGGKVAEEDADGEADAEGGDDGGTGDLGGPAEVFGE